MEFPDGLDVGCERKKGVRQNMKVLACAAERMKLLEAEMGRLC